MVRYHAPYPCFVTCFFQEFALAGGFQRFAQLMLATWQVPFEVCALKLRIKTLGQEDFGLRIIYHAYNDEFVLHRLSHWPMVSQKKKTFPKEGLFHNLAPCYFPRGEPQVL